MKNKEIIKDYFRAFRPGAVKEAWKSDSRSLTLMWCLLMGQMAALYLNRFLDDLVIMLAVLLPMIFAVLSGEVHPVRLKKMMYLAPMSKSERRRFIRDSYLFRVAASIVVSGIGVVILTQISRCDVLSIAEILISDFAVSIFLEPSGKQEHVLLKPFMILIAIISNMMQIVIVSNAEENLPARIAILVFSVIQLLLCRTYLKAVRTELAEAADYERSAQQSIA